MNSRIRLNPEKINPKFEGYKLTPCTEISNVSRFQLDQCNIQVYNDIKSDHRMGFRDLQARIRYSQLVHGFPLDNNRGTSFVIDQDYNLNMIVFDKSSKTTRSYLITELIKPLGPLPGFTEPDSTVPIQPQIPSAIAISRELVLVSNGVGDLELVGIEEKNGAMLGTSLASVCYLGEGNEGISPVPCMLLTARQVKNKIILVVYSHTVSKSTEFNIATLELDIPTVDTERLEDGSFVLLLKTLFIQKGPEVPVYCSITSSGKHVVLGSETKYNKVHLFGQQQQEEEEQVESMDITEEKPLYQWSQDGADITVLFELPAGTTKSDINCKFVTDHLILLVQKDGENTVSFPYRKLWSTVKADECVWTLDTDSVLTLFITKMDEHTRWPQLFDHDDGVLETISPIDLQEIKNRMDKFTAEDEPAVKKGSMLLNPALIQQHPTQHPAATDMDEEIDETGQPIVFSVYDINGNVMDEFNTGGYSWICKSFDHNHHQLPSVCLQMDVDGLVFGFKEDKETIQVTHTTTFDAFAFVQASKRDGRFVLHDPNFYFTCIIESSRNAYIYFHHDDKRETEVQTLVDLTQGHNVDVIGVQLILEKTLLVLTESQLIVIELQ